LFIITNITDGSNEKNLLAIGDAAGGFLTGRESFVRLKAVVSTFSEKVRTKAVKPGPHFCFDIKDERKRKAP